MTYILLLKANTHSRITRAMLHGRVVRLCNTGALRVTLSTRVTPVVHGRVIRLDCTGATRLCVKSSKKLDMLCFFVNMVAIRSQYGQHTGVCLDAVRQGPCWFLSILPSTCHQPIPVARYLQSLAGCHTRSLISLLFRCKASSYITGFGMFEYPFGKLTESHLHLQQWAL